MKFDAVVVGAGLAGSVAAERIAAGGKQVLVIESRNHIGGNCFDYYDQDGVLVHKYGPHIFHTMHKNVWDYLSQFTQWQSYIHKVIGQVDGQLVPIPFNLNTIEQVFPSQFAARLSDKLIGEYGYGKRVPILDMRQNQDPEINFLAEFVYEKVFLHYTMKQWGLGPEEVDPSVTARVPVVISRDDRYFTDSYQAMPVGGYTAMVERLLDSSNISLLLNTDYKTVIAELEFDQLIYTGPVDYYFDYKYGRLEYRALDFVQETWDSEFFQDAAVVNYPNDYDFTRITEFKRLTGQRHFKTVTMKEYPAAYEEGRNIACYPISSAENAERYEQYQSAVDELGNVVFLGRLAEYRYYNMDQVVKRVLDLLDG